MKSDFYHIQNKEEIQIEQQYLINRVFKIEDFLLISKPLTKHFQDLKKAYFLTFLFQYSLNKKEWFSITYNEIQKETFLPLGRQQKYVKELVKEGFISRKMMGLPAKQYFKILKWTH